MTHQELFNIVKNRKEPFSVVRFGDGESMLLNGEFAKVEWLCKRQLGYVPEQGWIDELKRSLVIAYKNADVIGLPENKREGLNEYWYKAKEILEGYVTLKETTTIDFHTEWLTHGYYDELLTGRDTLIYISCRHLEDQFKKRYGIKNVYAYHIAPEMKFTHRYTGKQHYPDQFNEIKDWIKEIPVKGNLCLVGAGFTGKVYNKWFKDAGGISLDLGCVFDMFAGLVTRGVNRGVNVIDETYKL